VFTMHKTFTRVPNATRCLAISLLALALTSCTKQDEPKALDEAHSSFATPEAAVEALVGAAEADDVAALKKIFGPGGESLVEWGDPVGEKQDRVTFTDMYRTKHELVDGKDGRKVLQVGAKDWPLPAPLVAEDGRWAFDGAEGADELVYRRVGRNELGAIAVAHGFVDAEYEYASKRRDGNQAGLFAAYLMSDPGRQNGLYWPTGANEAPSPAGPFVAAAAGEGYRRAAVGEPTPYHGYFYRMLYAQGDAAPGGAKGYFEEGRMVGGFAMVAWPANYAVSGVKTFIVNQDDVVYEKDFGPDTASAVDKVDLFNPDDTWDPVQAEPSD